MSLSWCSHAPMSAYSVPPQGDGQASGASSPFLLSPPRFCAHIQQLWLSYMVIEQDHQSIPWGSWSEARYNMAQFLTLTPIRLRAWRIKQRIPTQTLLVACWAPETTYVTQSSFAHMLMPWPAPAGLWAALMTPPTDQDPDSHLLYVQCVSKWTPSLRPAKQLSTAKTLAVQEGEDRGGLATHPSTQRRDDAFSHHSVLSHLEDLHKPLMEPKRSGCWCAGISQLCDIFGCCAVNHRQSGGRIRAVASGRLSQLCCPGAHLGSSNSHLGWELAASWGGVLLFFQVNTLKPQNMICDLTVVALLQSHAWV